MSIEDKRQTRYRIIYQEQKKKIDSGEYGPGAMLPVERVLCREYGVDRITVRHALSLLAEEGLIEKRAGVGSFVRIAGENASSGPECRNLLFAMCKSANEIESNPSAFNSELFYAMESECRKRGLSLFYRVYEPDSELAALTNGNAFRAIIFVSYAPDSLIRSCLSAACPALCVNHENDDLVSIVPANERGASRAVEYLTRLGHRRIAVLSGPPEYLSARARMNGFRTAMRAAELSPEPYRLLQADWTFEGARDAMNEMLAGQAQEALPTALFCMSDMMALGAMDALKERGIGIPDEISVVGFDGIEQAAYATPRLTTVSVDARQMARIAMEQAARLTELPGPYRIEIPARLTTRKSAGPARA